MHIKKFNEFLNESNEKTNVVFYIDTDGQPLAYFPDIDGDNKGNKTCYSHVGQHSGCHPDYVKNLKLATPDEYKDLEKELIGQGYDDLNILKENVNKIKKVNFNIKVGDKVTYASTDDLKQFDVTPSDDYLPLWSGMSGTVRQVKSTGIKVLFDKKGVTVSDINPDYLLLDNA